MQHLAGRRPNGSDRATVESAAFLNAEKYVPALRPQLPSADQILPYLRRIDATRIYSNWGPLSAEFEARICDHFGLPLRSFVCASSGTTALIGAILAAAGPATKERPFAVMPALTFVATAIAAERCSYQPYFRDVDAESWMLDPERLFADPELHRAGVVIPVAPFGRPVPQSPWVAFNKRTGVPVIIDGAASFDRLAAAPTELFGEIPVVLSFHATKSFGIGEGGGVATNDIHVAKRIGQALNFGFHENRDSAVASINGKMSEYHAAVGLAELDGWSLKSTALQKVADTYRCYLAETGLLDRLVVTPDISSSYALFRCCSRSESEPVMEALTRAGVEFRQWYGRGVHHQTHYSVSRRPLLPITHDLLSSLVGIPIAPDLTDSQVRRVVGALAAGVHASS
jgi:dTDP-4-amino-4,6-dideoxygalactose transaminase